MLPGLITYSQIKMPDGYAGTEFTGGLGKELPFWMMSNNYGIYSTNKDNAFARVAVSTHLDKNKNFDYSYGLDVLGRSSESNSNSKEFYTYGAIQQAYLQYKVYFFTLQAGKKEEHFGDQDSTLSCGGFAWSGNAQPIPSIAIYVNNYTPVPYTHGYLEFKGGLVHGWYGNQYMCKNAYMHHKYIALQAGGDLPIHAHFELHDYAQWGGDCYYNGFNNEAYFWKKQAGDLKAFYDVFLGRSTEIDSVFGKPVANNLGNHLGEQNIGVDYKGQQYSLNLYWHHYFETFDGFRWRGGLQDGLWGIVLKSNHPSIVSKLLYEFFHSTNQYGPPRSFWQLNGKKYQDSIPGSSFNIMVPENYFNHGVYRFGWTYNNYTIGNPLITSPIINGNRIYDNLSNNKVIAHHFGIEGVIKNLNYKFLYTFSLNYGTYDIPYNPVRIQNSMLLKVFYPDVTTYHLEFGITAGADWGAMYGNNLALSFNVKKQF
jgi:hypothetical protein